MAYVSQQSTGDPARDRGGRAPREGDPLRIAVTGAGGRLGGQVVDLLVADAKHEVVAIARREPASPRTDVHGAVADYSDARALRAALQGVDTLVFVSSDGPVAQVISHHHEVIRAAADSGVGHVVALSGLDADPRSPFCYAVSYAYTEQLLRDSGCAFSIARASIYSEFFLGFLTRAAATGGGLRLPAGDGRISLVSRSDVGRCMAALATAPPTAGAVPITGVESLAVAAIAAAAEHEWRTPIEYVEVTPHEYVEELARAGEDPWWTYAYSTMFASIREQRWSATSDAVGELTGAPALVLRRVLAEHGPR
jgi:NAD(P)H dehydrogenase (quinone)